MSPWLHTLFARAAAFRPWLRRLTLLTAAAAVGVLGGCAAIGNRGPVEQHVIDSRQHLQLGLEAADQRQWDDAERRFAEAVECCPDNPRAREHYAEALWQRGAAGEAIDQMELALHLGADPSLRVRLGQMYLAEGRLARAARQADLAVAADATPAAAWALRGDVLRREGHTDQALAAYHRALGYPQVDPWVRVEVAEIYRTLDRPDRAAATLQRALEMYVPGQEPQRMLYLQGLALKALGRHAEAVDALAAAADRGQATWPIMYDLAEAELLAGRPANARWAAQEAVRLAADPRPAEQLLLRIEEAQLAHSGRTPLH